MRHREDFIAICRRCIGTILLAVITQFLFGCEESESIGEGHDFGDNDADLYMAFGDSITAGYGVDTPYCYTPRLAAMLGRTVLNEGNPGEKSQDGVERVDSVLSAYKPGYLLILFGANDVIHGYDTDPIIRNLRTMIAAAKQNKTLPVIATLTPMYASHSSFASGVEALNREIRLLAAEEDAALADLERAFGDDESYMREDGLHPSAEGAEILALTFYGVLK